MSQNTISKLAHILSILLLIATIVVPIIFFLIVVMGDELNLELLGNAVIELGPDDFTLGTRAILAIFAAGYLTPLLVGFTSLRQTFNEAAAGRWLSEKSVVGFKRFAWANLIVICYEFFGGAIAVSFITMQQNPGQISIGVGLTAEAMATFFAAFMMLVVAHIFAVGQEAYEENKSFL